MYLKDTIAAIATPSGEGAIAIIRVSGPDAERIAREVFVPSFGGSRHLASHRLYHGHVRDPRTRSIQDEVLLALMRAPKSYTGEDSMEIHCHGSPYVARTVLRVVLSRGARHAEPGEFTRRAFLNGRLDLAQAEGVLELIQATSEKAARVAFEQLGGGLSTEVTTLRENLVGLLVQVEAAIDFPEEDIVLANRNQLLESLHELIERVEVLIASYQWGKLIREGVRICILGRPNVGKSSLLNALLGEERGVSLDGLPAVLWDTAGIHDLAMGIEQLGVDRTRQKIEECDGVLLVLDGSSPLTADDEEAMQTVRKKRGLIAVNKADLPPKLKTAALTEFLPDWQRVAVSALEKRGLGALRQELRRCFLDSSTEPEVVVTNLRHKASLEQAKDNLQEACAAMNEGFPPEILAVGLQGARDSLEEVIGTVTNDEVLDRIFSQFCIGK